MKLSRRRAWILTLDLPETSGHFGAEATLEKKGEEPENLDAPIIPEKRKEEPAAANTMPPPSVVNRNEAVEKEMLEGIEAIRNIKFSQKRVVETDPETQAIVNQAQIVEDLET